MKSQIVAWNSSPPSFWETDDEGQFMGSLPGDYEGLCSLNGFLYSTGFTMSGRRFWLCVEEHSVGQMAEVH